MPNKHDQKPYTWPQSHELKYFKSRVDSFPNGTVLHCYDPSLIKHSLDKLTKSDKTIKQEKSETKK